MGQMAHVGDWAYRDWQPLVGEDLQAAQLVPVEDQVDRDDPVVDDRQPDDRSHPAARPYDQAGSPVDQRRPAGRREPRAGVGTWRATSATPTSNEGASQVPAAGVRPEDDVRVQQLEQALEVADPAAARKAATTSRWRARSGSGGTTSPRTRRRARLASCRAAAGTPVEHRSRCPRTARRTCRAARTPAARRASASRARPAWPGRPSRRAVASCSGSDAARPELTIGSGNQRADVVDPTSLPSTQHVDADPADHRGQPAADVADRRRPGTGSAAARPPARHPRPRSPNRASDRPPPAAGHGAPRTAPPATPPRPRPPQSGLPTSLPASTYEAPDVTAVTSAALGSVGQVRTHDSRTGHRPPKELHVTTTKHLEQDARGRSHAAIRS